MKREGKEGKEQKERKYSSSSNYHFVKSLRNLLSTAQYF